MYFHGGFILFELLNQRVFPGIHSHCPRLPTQKCTPCCASRTLKMLLVPLPSRPSRFQGWKQPCSWEDLLQTTLSTPDEQQGPLTPRYEFKSGPAVVWVIRAINPSQQVSWPYWASVCSLVRWVSYCHLQTALVKGLDHSIWVYHTVLGAKRDIQSMKHFLKAPKISHHKTRHET